ncbi:putative corA-like Mg2+ transporter protein [Lyophyllum shimeji]|uniref:CorA-like Mg2+ transporter protein n=1 Tax=Lyophyllum shimeji TaxID=47721 RepID=A0A9P3US97_LYOSH|nr:putative corA-like Mg2+ transporter protein [Lyophyllum shimeji]
MRRPQRRKLEHDEAGAEQGINPRGPEAEEGYRVFKQACVIEVVDYSSEDVSLRRMGNQELVRLMEEEPSSARDEQKPDRDASEGSRRTIRWINIGGIDWEVIRATAVRYNLHALSIEDILREQAHNQSKADYYQEHLFIRILCHMLDPEVDAGPPAMYTPAGLPSGLDSLLESGERAGEKPTSAEPWSKSTAGNERRQFTSMGKVLGSARQRQLLKIRTLAKGDRVDVRQEPMAIFLLRDGGTVITIYPSPTLEFTSPITERLLHRESILRTSEDSSLLVESMLDLVVDRVLEITDEYQAKIHQVEQDALLRLDLSLTRTLHILSGDLVMHRRTLEPIKKMIEGIMTHDQQRCIALAEAGQPINPSEQEQPPFQQSGQQTQRVQGYFSFKAKTYMADVSDHMDFILTSLDMFAGISQNLINYAFNMASYDTNEVMRRLTLITLICSPLSVLTGYFGMNFQHFDAINGSVSLFWKIAVPVTVVLVVLFMITDGRREEIQNVMMWAASGDSLDHGSPIGRRLVPRTRTLEFVGIIQVTSYLETPEIELCCFECLGLRGSFQFVCVVRASYEPGIGEESATMLMVWMVICRDVGGVRDLSYGSLNQESDILCPK